MERNFLRAIADNIVGYDDGVNTPGERLGSGINALARGVWQDPVGMAGNALRFVEGDLNNLMFEGGAMERPWDVLSYAAAQAAPTFGRGRNPLVMSSGGAKPRALKPADQMAQDILDMRAAGRAGDVTGDMMATASPQYMYDNTPLPMDEASRMARAGEMGFDTGTPLYHGTAAEDGVNAFDTNFAGSVSQQPNEAATFLTENPKSASWFANYAHPDGQLAPYGGAGEGEVMPVTSRGNLRKADFRGQGYGNERMSANMDRAREGGFDGLDVVGMRENLDGFKPIDRQRAIFDPANIRSKFARFDPEFRHLANLSAVGAGAAYLGAQGAEQDQMTQIRNYLARLTQ